MKNGKTPGIRNSAVEALRVIAMFCIVLSHACVHSGFNVSEMNYGLNSLFVQWGTLGNLGTDIFALISGYFFVKKENCCRSICRLLLQVWFYSWSLFLVSRLFFDYDYSFFGYLQVFFPTIFNEYWFFTAYIVIALLVPYINLLLNRMDRQMFENMIILMLALWSVIPTVTTTSMYGDILAQFLLLYCIGAYFRLYPDNLLCCRAKRWGLVIVSAVLLLVSTPIMNMLSISIPAFINKGIYFYSRNSVLIIGCAVGMFSIAVYSEPFYNRLLNTLGACTFGIYLIHDNPAIRNIVWLRILRNAEYHSAVYLPVRLVLSAFLVFSVSGFIEYCRKKYVEERLVWIAERAAGRLRYIINNISRKT